jgi:hypothetical protein
MLMTKITQDSRLNAIRLLSSTKDIQSKGRSQTDLATRKQKLLQQMKRFGGLMNTDMRIISVVTLGCPRSWFPAFDLRDKRRVVESVCDVKKLLAIGRVLVGLKTSSLCHSLIYEIFRHQRMSSNVESHKQTSLAEKLAASARQSQQSAVNQAGNAQGKALASRALQSSGSANIPARLEEALDVEGDIPINEVEVGGTVSGNRMVRIRGRKASLTQGNIPHDQPLLKILKHSTDPSSSSASSNPNPVDAVGLLLGLDLSGVAEIVDSYPLPGGVQGALHAVGTGGESDKSE